MGWIKCQIREPKKTWYWIPFTGAILIFLIGLSEIIYLKTPKVGPWAPPDTGDLFRAVRWNIVIVLQFLFQGINGIYQYKKRKSKMNNREW